VGYQIRFENCTSAKTKIRFVTEGVLLRQLIEDPQLRGVSAILFDEFHERHLYGDITLARALDLQEQQRPDLKLAVMSATLNAGELEKYLSANSVNPGAPAGPLFGARLEGRTFPVEIEYLPRRVGLNGPPVWELAAEEFARFVNAGGEGDVLVFMPGGFEIAQTIEAIRHTSEAKGYIILPLHGELRPRTRTRRWRVISSPRWWWPRTSPRRASRLTGCGW
jgi:ATP-dependent helicase HrpB